MSYEECLGKGEQEDKRTWDVRWEGAVVGKLDAEGITTIHAPSLLKIIKNPPRSV